MEHHSQDPYPIPQASFTKKIDEHIKVYYEQEEKDEILAKNLVD